MPDNQNPYMDPMNPNGYVPNYPQGYGAQPDPYMQQGAWNQGQFGMPQQGYADEYLNPDVMMSPQDIYANQAVQMGSPYGTPSPYQDPYADPNAGYMDPSFGAQPYQDPYGQQSPYGQQPGAQPFYDPMQGMPGMGQMGSPYGMDPSQSGQMPPVSPSQTGGFESPMPMGQPGMAGMPFGGQQQAGMPGQQMPGQQMPGQQMPGQQPVPAEQAEQPQGGKQKKQKQSQVQPMPTVGKPVIDPSKATNGKATLALVLSILGIILSLIPPLGLVLSIFARKISKAYMDNGGRAASGEAARVFSLVALIFSIVMCAILVWFLGCAMQASGFTIGALSPIEFYNNSPIGHLFRIG